MTKDEMEKSIFLCDYQTGVRIPFDSEPEIKSDWRVSFNKNDYLGLWNILRPGQALTLIYCRRMIITVLHYTCTVQKGILTRK